MSTIQGIKLTTGEELVAEIASDQSHIDKVAVKNPLVLIMSNGPKGIVVNFMPWTIIAEGVIRIENHAIAARYLVPKEVEDNYLQNTSGIQIVSAPPQILKG